MPEFAQKKTVKTVFITSFHPHISRNILSTDALGLLRGNENLKVIVIVPDYKTEYFRQNFQSENVFVEGVKPFLASKTRKGLFFKRLGFFLFDTKTARSKKRYEYIYGRKYLLYFFSLFLGFLSHSLLIRKITRFLDFYFSPKGIYSELFNRYKPDLVFSTDVQNENDVAFLHEARRRNIETIGMIRSWDNPTQRIIRFLPSKILVGSATLKEEVEKFYCLSPEKIIITGNPHYDRYAGGPSVGREEFFRKFGMDPAKKMIVYAPVGDCLIRKNDVDRYIMEMLGGINSQVLVRFPPDEGVALADFKKPANMFYDQPGVAFKSNEFGDREISLDDDQRLIDEIYHCDLAITGPTSICLDAAFLDKPVIMANIYPFPRDFYGSIFNYWYSHIDKLRASGGVCYCTEKAGFLKMIDEYLSDPRIDSEGRKILRSWWFSHADGCAGKRVADEIIRSAGL